MNYEVELSEKFKSSIHQVYNKLAHRHSTWEVIIPMRLPPYSGNAAPHLAVEFDGAKLSIHHR